MLSLCGLALESIQHSIAEGITYESRNDLRIPRKMATPADARCDTVLLATLDAHGA